MPPPHSATRLPGRIRLHQAPTLLLLAGLAASLLFNSFRLWPFALAEVLLLGGLAWRLGSNAAPAHPSPLALALLAWWGWLALATSWSEVPYMSAIAAWRAGALILAFAILRLDADRDRGWQVFRAGLALLASALALWGAWQLLAEGTQPRSLFANPNSHAAFLAMCALLTLPPALTPEAAGRSARLIPLGTYALLVFGMAIVGGRGATLAFLGGLALVLLATWRRLSRGNLAVALAATSVSLLAAQAVTGGRLSERLATLQNPATAGQDRWIIWEGAWQMLRDAPWHGIGPGVFWFAYPAYRSPADASGGFYAHNDYLQLAIEAGIPAVLLTLAVGLAALSAWRRALAGGRRTAAEASGAFAAFAAMAVHSLVTFNLYVMPLLVLAGTALARLDRLAHPAETQAAGWRWKLFRNPRRRAFVLLLIWLVPVSYLGALAWSDQAVHFGRTLAATWRAADADILLARASRLSPALDTPFVARAELRLRILEQNAVQDRGRRASLKREAFMLLDEAHSRNPLRVAIPHLRGRLHMLDPQQDLVAAEQSFREALRLDPMFTPARLSLGKLLRRDGRTAEARRLLREGVDRWYPPEPRHIAFLRFAATALDGLGDPEGAARARAAAVELARAREKLLRRQARGKWWSRHDGRFPGEPASASRHLRD